MKLLKHQKNNNYVSEMRRCLPRDFGYIYIVIVLQHQRTEEEKNSVVAQNNLIHIGYTDMYY